MLTRFNVILQRSNPLGNVINKGQSEQRLLSSYSDQRTQVNLSMTSNSGETINKRNNMPINLRSERQLLSRRPSDVKYPSSEEQAQSLALRDELRQSTFGRQGRREQRILAQISVPDDVLIIADALPSIPIVQWYYFLSAILERDGYVHPRYKPQYSAADLVAILARLTQGDLNIDDYSYEDGNYIAWLSWYCGLIKEMNNHGVLEAQKINLTKEHFDRIRSSGGLTHACSQALLAVMIAESGCRSYATRFVYTPAVYSSIGQIIPTFVMYPESKYDQAGFCIAGGLYQWTESRFRRLVFDHATGGSFGVSIDDQVDEVIKDFTLEDRGFKRIFRSTGFYESRTMVDALQRMLPTAFLAGAVGSDTTTKLVEERVKKFNDERGLALRKNFNMV